ncbi:hypothetical protein [Mycolicibacterium sp. CR10]|uniref:hypothetical protein n=1 Tax=Mycolicibacterium sp. CR10 TaxID=2562314 RepID=UPI0010C06F37|nr:hypothetical protein [Mycolicibacterium sp. CR10]
MTTITNRIAAAATIALGSAAVAFGAAAVTAPIAGAATFQETCVNDPASYGSGAVRGVYTTEKRGIDRYEICKVYTAANALAGTFTVPNYGYYKLAVPVTPPPLSVEQPSTPAQPTPTVAPPLSIKK